MSYVPDLAVAVAKSFIGYREGYNNSNMFSVWQGLDDNNPWCASFTCYCSWHAGYRFPTNNTFGERGEAYTPTTKQRALEEGLWHTKEWRAQPGDHVLFDWGNNGLIDHVELVVWDDGNKIITIGGNTSNGCYYRTRDRTYVAGFYALSQSSQVAAPPPPPPKVRPMYDPPLPVVARLHHPNGGWWDAYQHGHVDFLSPTGAINPGGMTSDQERKDFGDRSIARLRPRTRNDGLPGYIIVATDGKEYIPEEQR